jgi:hypothetical protein
MSRHGGGYTNLHLDQYKYKQARTLSRFAVSKLQSPQSIVADHIATA